MRELIWRDVVLNRNAILVNVLVFTTFLGYAAWDAASPGAYIFFAAIMFSVVPITIVTREDKFKAMGLCCSLPVTRRGIVRARYVLSVGFGVAGILLALSLGAAMPFSSLDVATLLGHHQLLIAITLVTLIVSLLLPFTLRFGFMGLLVLMVALQVLGSVLLIIAQITKSSADKRVVAAVAGTVRAVAARLGEPAFSLAVLGTLALVVTVSYVVAVHVFERREL
jgi:hypothetical protein